MRFSRWLRLKRRSAMVLLFVCFLLSNVTLMIMTAEATPQKQYAPSQGSWLTGWTYRQRYNITNVTGAGADYQVFLNVSYDSRMQNDFDDLRVTDNDGITLLDSWLQDKSNGAYARAWIEITDSLENATWIYLYFGNSTVSDYWDGPATFLLFDDFNDDSFNATLWHQHSGTSTEADGYLEQTDTSEVLSDDTFPFARAVGTRSYFEEARSITGFLNHDDWWDDALFLASKGTVEGMYSRENAASTEDAYDFDEESWQYLETRWYSGDLTKGFLERVEVTSVNTNVPSDSLNVYLYTYEPDDELLRTDWVYVRKCASSEPTITIVGVWTENVYVEIVMPVGWNPAIQFGYDAFFIFLGLIMIPVSTMYLVKGGRQEMNTDKLFIGLIVFCVGLALFIGGIMP